MLSGLELIPASPPIPMSKTTMNLDILPPPPPDIRASICRRCGGAILRKRDAVLCTHFTSFPTIAHRYCSYAKENMHPKVGLRWPIVMAPIFCLGNLLSTILIIFFTIIDFNRCFLTCDNELIPFPLIGLAFLTVLPLTLFMSIICGGIWINLPKTK